MKLISMTDFVCQILDANFEFSEIKMLNTIQSYALFLKHPLTLGMFVPCDEDGNILEEPNPKEIYPAPTAEEEIDFLDCLEQYKQAKEKVLFVFKPHFDISAIKHHILQDRNIEYLANFGELELTENAIKQIGL